MIVAIGGASRSGKTRLSEHLQHILKDSHVISQDDYAIGIDDIPKIKGSTNWECPESIDWGRLWKDLQQSKSQYQNVIIEGFLIYWDTTILELADRYVFMDIDKETFIRRRPLDNRWNNEPDWYHEHVWQSYLKYGQAPRHESLVTLDGNDDHFDIKQIKTLLDIK